MCSSCRTWLLEALQWWLERTTFAQVSYICTLQKVADLEDTIELLYGAFVKWKDEEVTVVLYLLSIFGSDEV